MAEGKIKKDQVGLTGVEVRQINIPLTLPAGGDASTNLKRAIDADMPAGKRFLALAGFTSNQGSSLFVAVYYRNTNWSLQLRNVSGTSYNLNVEISYLCANA